MSRTLFCRRKRIKSSDFSLFWCETDLPRVDPFKGRKLNLITHKPIWMYKNLSFLVSYFAFADYVNEQSKSTREYVVKPHLRSHVLATYTKFSNVIGFHFLSHDCWELFENLLRFIRFRLLTIELLTIQWYRLACDDHRHSRLLFDPNIQIYRFPNLYS
jgi:hypothetical protein